MLKSGATKDLVSNRREIGPTGAPPRQILRFTQNDRRGLCQRPSAPSALALNIYAYACFVTASIIAWM